MSGLLSNPDFWLGAAMGAVFLVLMVTGCCWAMEIMDKTKATRALAGAVDGRPNKSTYTNTAHCRLSRGEHDG